MGLDVVKKVLLQKKSQSVLNNMQILKGARPLNVPLRPKITFEYHFFTSYPIAYIYFFFLLFMILIVYIVMQNILPPNYLVESISNVL